MDWRIGCSSWTSPAWRGRVYPPDLPDGERLAWYARHWPVVEVDSTYYRAPVEAVVRGWARKTPDAFRFALKVPRDLLDPRRPVALEAVDRFARVVESLGTKRGPLLAQFPPWFGASGRHESHLSTLVDRLSGAGPLAVELRESGWFRGATFDRLRRHLHDRAVALAWSCLTYLQVPPELTTDWVYLRFIADHTTVPEGEHGRLAIDRTPETTLWARRVGARAADLREAWVFFNNHFAGFAPDSLNLFRREVGLPSVQYGLAERPGALEGYDPAPGSSS